MENENMSRKGWLLLLVHSALVFMFAWQLDIVCSPLVFEVRERAFWFLYHKISFWEAYTFFFWGLGLVALAPEIIMVADSLKRRLRRK